LEDYSAADVVDSTARTVSQVLSRKMLSCLVRVEKEQPGLTRKGSLRSRTSMNE